MTTSSAASFAPPRATGLITFVGGLGIFLYTAFFAALLLVPVLGVETQAIVVERRQEPDLDDRGRPKDTKHDVSVYRYADAQGQTYLKSEDEKLADQFAVRYFAFFPNVSQVVTPTVPYEGATYAFGAILGLAAAGQGARWLFSKT